MKATEAEEYFEKHRKLPGVEVTIDGFPRGRHIHVVASNGSESARTMLTPNEIVSALALGTSVEIIETPGTRRPKPRGW